jgi:hypothetical protein
VCDHVIMGREWPTDKRLLFISFGYGFGFGLRRSGMQDLGVGQDGHS